MEQGSVLTAPTGVAPDGPVLVVIGGLPGSGKTTLLRRLLADPVPGVTGLDSEFVADEWPFDVELSSPQARFFQLYSPTSAPIFVAEPVTHANAALSEPEEGWAELGIKVLAPGEAMALDMRLDVQPK